MWRRAGSVARRQAWFTRSRGGNGAAAEELDSNCGGFAPGPQMHADER
jgi:hypothetical protein